MLGQGRALVGAIMLRGRGAISAGLINAVQGGEVLRWGDT